MEWKIFIAKLFSNFLSNKTKLLSNKNQIISIFWDFFYKKLRGWFMLLSGPRGFFRPSESQIYWWYKVVKCQNTLFWCLLRASQFNFSLSNFPLSKVSKKINFALIWFFLPFVIATHTGDSIFTAGKPAILANNTLIRGSKALNNRRPITSSSSTISSQSTNNETGRADRDRKDKTLKDSMQQRYLMDSGN